MLALLAPFTLLAGCDRQSQAPAQQSQGNAAQTQAPAPLTGGVDRSHAGAPLPALAFHDPAGHALRLAGLAGKPLLVNFWATWCAPCVAELPTLRQLAEHNAGTLRVIAVSEDLGEPARVGAFWKAHGFTGWPLWLDPNNDAAGPYAFATLPTTVYYDSTGHEVWRFTGGRDWTSPDSVRLLGLRAP